MRINISLSLWFHSGLRSWGWRDMQFDSSVGRAESGQYLNLAKKRLKQTCRKHQAERLQTHSDSFLLNLSQRHWHGEDEDTVQRTGRRFDRWKHRVWRRSGAERGRRDLTGRGLLQWLDWNRNDCKSIIKISCSASRVWLLGWTQASQSGVWTLISSHFVMI